MTPLIIFLWVAFIATLLLKAGKKAFLSPDRYLMQDWEKVDMPYITMTVEGHKLNFITDSAASVSIIKGSVLPLISFENSDRQVALAALTEDTIQSKVVDLTLPVNGENVTTNFVVYEEDIAGFRCKYGIEIHGLLGVEFFRKTSGIINFRNHTVTFPLL
jgi:hypothetical protein